MTGTASGDCGDSGPSGTMLYLNCELCGRAFSPLKVKFDRLACCPACRKQERDIALDRCSPSLARKKALRRKTQESRDAVARRLKGT